MNGLKNFSLSNLHELDNGKANTVVNNAIRDVVLDLQDRPGDPTKRVVTIDLEFTPDCDERGALSQINAQIKVKSKVPIRQTVPYPMLVTPDGRPQFHPRSPMDPRQAALFDAEQAQRQREEAEAGDLNGD